MRTLLAPLALVLSLSLPSVASAQFTTLSIGPGGAANGALPPAKKLVVDATAAPTPTLRYRLLPAVHEQEPGNAALLYYRAMLPESFSHRRMENIDEKLMQWKDLPLAELPRSDMDWLLRYRPLLDSDQAARRDACDWELLSRLKAEGAETLLPDVQGMRELSRLNALRTRLYLMNRDYANAARTLSTGLSLAQQVGESPVLISGLVGVACGKMTLDGVEEWMQTPQAPNLYWSLTVLPQPCVDFRRPLEGERLFLLATLAKKAPEVLTAETRVFSPAEAQNVLRRLRELLTMMDNSVEPGAFGLKDAATALMLGAAVAAMEGDARTALVAAGHNAADIQAMPAVQVVVLHMLLKFHSMHDDILRFSSLPYWEARPRLQEFEKRLIDHRTRNHVFPIEALMPAVSKAHFATVRLDRQIAALRTIEALRLYAAGHDGKFPAKLSDLTEAPAAIDPVTGKPFEYRVVDGKAIVLGPPPEGDQPNESSVVHYEVTLRGAEAK